MVSKQTNEVINTISFLNIPLSKQLDPNISTLHEVLIRLKN